VFEAFTELSYLVVNHERKKAADKHMVVEVRAGSIGNFDDTRDRESFLCHLTSDRDISGDYPNPY
jgi:hypothetical protein